MKIKKKIIHVKSENETPICFENYLWKLGDILLNFDLIETEYYIKLFCNIFYDKTIMQFNNIK